MKRINKIAVSVFLALSFLLTAIPVSAADELLGTIVDGSLLTDETEAIGYAYPKLRGKYFSYGSGAITIEGSHWVGLSGTTSAYQNVGQIQVTIFLQRLKNGSWTHVLTLGPRIKYNTYTVSTSGTYKVDTGYYYRAYGHHVIIHNGTTEGVPSYSNGVWVG